MSNESGHLSSVTALVRVVCVRQIAATGPYSKFCSQFVYCMQARRDRFGALASTRRSRALFGSGFQPFTPLEFAMDHFLQGLVRVLGPIAMLAGQLERGSRRAPRRLARNASQSAFLQMALRSRPQAFAQSNTRTARFGILAIGVAAVTLITERLLFPRRTLTLRHVTWRDTNSVIRPFYQKAVMTVTPGELSRSRVGNALAAASSVIARPRSFSGSSLPERIISSIAG